MLNVIIDSYALSPIEIIYRWIGEGSVHYGTISKSPSSVLSFIDFHSYGINCPFSSRPYNLHAHVQREIKSVEHSVVLVMAYIADFGRGIHHCIHVVHCCCSVIFLV